MKQDSRVVYSTTDGDLRKARDPKLKERRADGDRVKVRREVAGRRGKAVTTVSGVPVDDAELKRLAGKLKKRCRVGGSVKGGVIEMQGDHRDVVVAAGAVKGGRVHVDGVAVKPSREVGPGDELEITIGTVRRTVIVRGAAERRVSAADAANLYDETEKSVAERKRQAELRRLAGPVDLGGRPTKRDRRRYDIGHH